MEMKLTSINFSHRVTEGSKSTWLQFLVNQLILDTCMLCAKHGSGQSVDCPAQTMDPRFAQQFNLCATIVIIGFKLSYEC